MAVTITCGTKIYSTAILIWQPWFDTFNGWEPYRKYYCVYVLWLPFHGWILNFLCLLLVLVVPLSSHHRPVKCNLFSSRQWNLSLFWPDFSSEVASEVNDRDVWKSVPKKELVIALLINFFTFGLPSYNQLISQSIPSNSSHQIDLCRLNCWSESNHSIPVFNQIFLKEKRFSQVRSEVKINDTLTNKESLFRIVGCNFTVEK